MHELRSSMPADLRATRAVSVAQHLALAAAVPLAWAIDARFGEPRDAWHPVAWFGSALAPVGRRLKRLGPVAGFIGGALVWLAVAITLGVAAWALQRGLLALPVWLAVPLLAILLKPMFAWRMLREEVTAVEAALAHGEPAARARLVRLVSRDVSTLDAETIRETAIETLAENLNDSLVAPLFWYAIFGLPGAVVYRAANTLDAMWGYRGAWEWAGKWAARADDVLSWVPARLTAVLSMLLPLPETGSEPASGFDGSAWQRLRTEARRTPSPNGGWTMGAMALRLGVHLRKPGVYTLNGRATSPGPQQVMLAVRLGRLTALSAVALVASAWAFRAVLS
ncbi:adenosylcobinamide-phosphate synthase CbiB [soil metagenome]